MENLETQSMARNSTVERRDVDLSCYGSAETYDVCQRIQSHAENRAREVDCWDVWQYGRRCRYVVVLLHSNNSDCIDRSDLTPLERVIRLIVQCEMVQERDGGLSVRR